MPTTQHITYGTTRALSHDKVKGHRAIADNVSTDMPKELEQALMRTFHKRKKAGKLKGVSKGQYVYGSKAMQDYMKHKRGK